MSDILGLGDVAPSSGAVGRVWVDRFVQDGRDVDALASSLGLDVPHRGDYVELLTERAEARGLRPAGRVSAGGAARLLDCADGLVAVNLPRATDWEAVPAWLEIDGASSWEPIEAAVAGKRSAELVERAQLLALAVAAVPSAPLPASRLHHGVPRTYPATPTVLDLSAMWAGPLAGALLAAAGCRVVKLDSIGRPDGVKEGDPAFYRRLNDAKDHVAADLRTVEGLALLRQLIAESDIVIDSSRPRAMQQLGIDVEQLVRATGVLWVSITGHGRDDGRAAFGDDAAAAGGLVRFGAEGPSFVGDAAADPITGLTAAKAVLSCMVEGRTGLLEMTMRGSVAALLADDPATPNGE